MKRTGKVLVAIVDGMALALPLAGVERVIRAAAVQPVPAAGGCLLGTLDIGGELRPVYDTRKLLGVPTRPLHPDDRMVLVRAPVRCALLVDDVRGPDDASDAVIAADSSTLRAAGLRGIAEGPDGALLLQDMERLLALERVVPLADHA
jgi:purine-binding chemotaxis protein CheW